MGSYRSYGLCFLVRIPSRQPSSCSWKTSLMLWLDGSRCKRDLEGEGSIWLSGLGAGSPGLGGTGTGQMPLALAQTPWDLPGWGPVPGKTWVSPLGGPTWCPGGGQVTAHCPRKRPPAPGKGAGPRGRPGSAQNRAPASVPETQTGSEGGRAGWTHRPLTVFSGVARGTAVTAVMRGQGWWLMLSPPGSPRAAGSKTGLS